MSAPTILASWAVGHPTSTALPKKARSSPTGAASRAARPARAAFITGSRPPCRPDERGDETALYDKWMIDRVFVQAPAQNLVAQWPQSFQDFPIRQKPASFNLDAVMAKLSRTKD